MVQQRSRFGRTRALTFHSHLTHSSPHSLFTSLTLHFTHSSPHSFFTSLTLHLTLRPPPVTTFAHPRLPPSSTPGLPHWTTPTMGQPYCNRPSQPLGRPVSPPVGPPLSKNRRPGHPTDPTSLRRSVSTGDKAVGDPAHPTCLAWKTRRRRRVLDASCLRAVRSAGITARRPSALGNPSPWRRVLLLSAVSYTNKITDMPLRRGLLRA